MNNALQLIIQVLLAALIIAGLGWLFWQAIRKSYNPALLFGKWLATFVLLGAGIKMGLPLIYSGNPFVVVAGVLIVAALAIIVGLIWAPNWGEMLFSPITNMWDGGDEEVEPTPVYSSAQAKQLKGNFSGAVSDIRQQLEKFPHDLTGQLLLAQIQAENLNDVAGAEVTIERILHQPGHTPANITAALLQLADSHLKFGQDRDAAQRAFERIITLFPGTPFAQTAAQRIAHLPNTERILQSHDQQKIAVGHYDKYIGIKAIAAAETKPTEEQGSDHQAADYLKHLQQHPLDIEVREKLAVIYAEKYRRLDLAAGEIETLVSQPGATTKQVARWLNLLTDLYLRIGNDVPKASQCLDRIESLFPGTAYAEQANTRRAYLKLEVKRHEVTPTVKLGVYEKDVGLRVKKNSRE